MRKGRVRWRAKSAGPGGASPNLFFSWPPNFGKHESDPFAGFVILLLLGTLAFTCGVVGLGFDELCWKFGDSFRGEVVDRFEMQSRGTTYHLRYRSVLQADGREVSDARVSPEFYQRHPLHSVVEYRAFPFWRQAPVVDRQQNWNWVIAILLGAGLLVSAAGVRKTHKQETGVDLLHTLQKLRSSIFVPKSDPL